MTRWWEGRGETSRYRSRLRTLKICLPKKVKDLLKKKKRNLPEGEKKQKEGDFPTLTGRSSRGDPPKKESSIAGGAKRQPALQVGKQMIVAEEKASRARKGGLKKGKSRKKPNSVKGKKT